MDQVDAVVIGAGVVGLAVARALAQGGRETIVLEAQGGIGQGVSSRNSEVIHAGLYYAPGSLKARLCVRGKELLYALCASHGVEHRRCGKLTVANSAGGGGGPARSAGIVRRRTGWRSSGWSSDRRVAMEPALRCIAALHSPSTGIVDSHGFMLALQGDLERAGGMVAFGAQVDVGAAGRPPAGSHVVRLADGTELATRLLVNAASLHACALARRFEGLDPRFVPREWFAKGNYYALSGPRALHPPDLPRAGRCAPGHPLDAGPRRPGQVRARYRVAGHPHARGDRLARGSGACRRLLRGGAALLAAACPTAACSPATAACGPRSTGRMRRRRISGSTGRRCTGCRGW